MNEAILYGIRDHKLEAFCEFFFIPNNAVAVRRFDLRVNDGNPDDQVTQWPEDFSLWRLGRVTMDQGDVEKEDQVMLARGFEIKRKDS